ncbi:MULTISPECIES: nucleoside deaminase [unclassified Clostridium]|uniref:nucleoside deaminase n=1 Tax=unclassified Clostridium TaxID=2614128 RepID=UPI00029785A7|nr:MULTISPECIES: nucleoside deaminase [unclassified Clostridium]EKQ57209.1 MAG: cytosine/adenosine deaminase [Clostridium sp. Maddingley MBC34-26]
MGIMTVEEKMRLVLSLAEEGAKQGEIPIAAIIFHGDNIVSKAYTTEKKEGRYLVHAELQVMMEMDKQKCSIKTRKEMQLFTNLEPCMMCLGTAIHSFVGEIYYSLESPTDGGAVWTEKTWNDYHPESIFKLPKVYGKILEEESKELFKRFLNINPKGGISDWVKTLI